MKASNLVIGAGMLMALVAAVPTVSASDTYTDRISDCAVQGTLDEVVCIVGAGANPSGDDGQCSVIDSATFVLDGHKNPVECL